MRRLVLAVYCLFLISSLAAQNKSRGVSRQGKIINHNKSSDLKVLKHPQAEQVSGLECRLEFEEPSGDGILSKGEQGFVNITIFNNEDEAVKPKLEIMLRSSWSTKPSSMIKWMDRILPGQSGEYQSAMSWRKELPAGSITYRVVAVDVNTGIKSDPVQIDFMTAGKGTPGPDPIFVNVDKTIPTTYVSNKDAIAVIIGNQSYQHIDIPDVDFAIQDAKIMKKYLINMLGYYENNIIYVENAEKIDFESIFGTKGEYQGKLFNYTKANQSDVFIYYSGHGSPDANTKNAYFIPSNADPAFVRINGYSLDVFYRNLEKLPAKTVTVVLDACFSGGSQQGMLLKNASPIFIDVKMPVAGSNINLLTSASGNQISSWYPQGNHSLFTYYLLRAMRGEADIDHDRVVTLNEAGKFLKKHVPYMARRLYSREQTPLFKGNPNTVLSTY